MADHLTDADLIARLKLRGKHASTTAAAGVNRRAFQQSLAEAKARMRSRS